MRGPGPWVSLRFYWLLPPGSLCVTWKLEREKVLARLYLTYLEAEWIFLKPFPNTYCHSPWAPVPDPTYQISPPTFLAKASKVNIIFPNLSLPPPPSLPFSSTHLNFIFYFLLHPSHILLFLIIPNTGNLLVPVTLGC